MDLGRAVLFAGSALLLISLFTDWYDDGLTGWQVFESLDLVLAALAIGGMVGAARPDLLPSWSGLGIPGAAIAIVVVQLIDAPPAAAGSDPSGGAWVALAGAFLMAAGAALSLSAISVTVQVRERDVRRRVAAVDRRGEDVEDDEAEDLDADAPSGSLFGSGFAARPSDDDAAAPEAPSRTRRFAPRETPAAAPEAPGTPPPARPEAADLERTQPLSSLPDDEDDAPERR
jgi:hypothetical protein